MADRKTVMKKAQEIGHCLCNLQEKCPCETFIKEDICKCAGEKK